ncbi:hypothetical protein [Rhodococcus sp. 06-418-5]|uniref:hypothetical protein n=1 Tax=Rhodococcus sp. 06-418-5 TaxID=2022507 RepID=UPI00117B6B38|nr:hypothetical protein [Rhodococcus sp. 06-418-5]
MASVVAALPDIAIVPLETGEFFEWADGTQTQVWDGPLQTVQTWPEANEIILRDDFEHSVSVADVARQGAIFLAAARAAGGLSSTWTASTSRQQASHVSKRITLTASSLLMPA